MFSLATPPSSLARCVSRESAAMLSVAPPVSSPIWPTRPAISAVALVVRSASLRTSSATTAKPRPCSPARAASMAALSASRLVWSAISLIRFTMLTILLARSPSAATFSAAVAELADSDESVSDIRSMANWFACATPKASLALPRSTFMFPARRSRPLDDRPIEAPNISRNPARLSWSAIRRSSALAWSADAANRDSSRSIWLRALAASAWDWRNCWCACASSSRLAEPKNMVCSWMKLSDQMTQALFPPGLPRSRTQGEPPQEMVAEPGAVVDP